MKKQMLITIIIVIFFGGLSGCINISKETESIDDYLTDEDWGYFVWQYGSAQIMLNYTNTASEILQIISFNPLLVNFTKLQHMAQEQNQTITNHFYINNHFNLSNRIDATRKIYGESLNYYYLECHLYNSICELNFSSDAINLVAYEYFNDLSVCLNHTTTNLIIMGNMINESISDEEWNEWTEGRDWSFIID